MNRKPKIIITEGMAKRLNDMVDAMSEKERAEFFSSGMDVPLQAANHNPPASRAREEDRMGQIVAKMIDGAAMRIIYDDGKERRERIATAMLQGYLAAGLFGGSPESRAKRAVLHADALIAELDRKGGE